MCASIPNKWLTKDPLPESIDSGSSCYDLIDNDYNGYSVSCPDSQDGSITVEVQGGSGFYYVTFLNQDGEIVGEIPAVLSPNPFNIDGDEFDDWMDLSDHVPMTVEF